MRASTHRFLVKIVGPCLLVVSCTVGPDYEPPHPVMPDAFGGSANDGEIGHGHEVGRTDGEARVGTRVDAKGDTRPNRTAALSDEAAVDQQGKRSPHLTHLPAAAQADSKWWNAFKDPVLSALVQQAMQGNLRIEVALARLDEARAVRRARAGRLLPMVTSSTTAGKSRASGNGPGPLGSLAEAGLATLENKVYTVGFDAGWELDLFGGVRRGQEAAQARLESTEENLRALALLIAAETANAYIDVRGAELRLGLAQRNLNIQNATLVVIAAKVSSGLLSAIDLERSKTQQASLEAALPPLRVQRASAVHRLAVLTGEVPGQMAMLAVDNAEPGGKPTFPQAPTAIASGLPAELLLRRPDLRAAERELQASTAEVGVAVADRYPSVVVGGSYGLESGSLSDLLQSASRIWSFGPRLDLPIFQGGRLAAQVEVAKARLRASRANFESTVLRALEDVETALVAHQQSQIAEGALRRAVQSSRSTSEHAGTLYELGLRDHLVLLDAQRSQTAIEDALAISRIEVAQSAIRLYLALGGGWQELEVQVKTRNEEDFGHGAMESTSRL